MAVGEAPEETAGQEVTMVVIQEDEETTVVTEAEAILVVTEEEEEVADEAVPLLCSGRSFLDQAT